MEDNMNNNTPQRAAPHAHPGEHIITRAGTTRIVALVTPGGLVFAYGPDLGAGLEDAA
jgi:hypothetical protein